MPFTFFRMLAEERIREAIERGEFTCENYKGKPLELKEDPFVPEDLKIVYRILKNAGFLPKEVELRKEIYQTLETLLDEEHQDYYQKLRKLSGLLFHLNQIRNSPLKVEEEYYAKILTKIKSKASYPKRQAQEPTPKKIDFAKLQTLLSIKSFYPKPSFRKK